MTVAPQMVGPSSSSGGPVPSPDVDELLADIGDRIRAERKARRWSQTELGRRAGIGLPTVRRLENGHVWMRSLLQACHALGVPVDHLLSGDWAPPKPEPVRLELAPRQVEVLREAATGDSLTRIGARLGMDSRAVGALLSRAYLRLGVAYLPVADRRAAAVRVAMQHGLFDQPPKRTP